MFAMTLASRLHRGFCPGPALALTLALVLVLVLAGCGAGSGTEPATASSPNATGASATLTNATLTTQSTDALGPAAGRLEVVQPDFVPSAATLAAKNVNSAQTFGVTGLVPLSDQACSRPIKNKTVYEQAHTLVFAADGISEAEQQEVAEYAEAAVRELRSRITGDAGIGLGMDRKVQICVQPQRVGVGAAAMSALKYSDHPPAGTVPGYGGYIIIQGAQAFFSDGLTRDTLAEGYQRSFQEVYRRTLMHEATHIVEFFRSGLAIEQWLTEGVARYMEFGKSPHTRAEILALIAVQNPVALAWPAAYPRPALNGNKGYFAAAAVVAYLLSPEGANNSLATWVALLERNRADTAAFVKKCLVTPLPADCPATEAAFEAVRSQYFVAAFEAVIKERDGSPMKLHSGPNNLQDTLSERLAAFW